MYILELNNKENWEDFLLRCDEKTFLDSWNWGEFQKREGQRIWRFGIYDNEKLISVALVIKVKARRGTFLFVPHGPNIINPKSQIPNPKQISNLKSQILNTLLMKLKEIAKEEKAHFIRIASIWEKSKQNSDFFERLGFIPAPIHIHPEVTWELDIKRSEQELLMNMRKTTRYLIRQAQKNTDIEIIKSNNIDDLERFGDLLNKTADRHHFVPFSLNYLKNQFSCFALDNQIVIYLGRYKEEIISGAVMIFWQNIGFYHHGASLSKYNKIPVSYLLQWEAIKEAKRQGCEKYNFWGIAPNDNKNHAWTGLSLFKRGFGGYRKDYVQTQDLSLSKMYYLITRPFEKIRRIKRGL